MDLLLERSKLTFDGKPKKRTRAVSPIGMTRRDVFSRIERRFRDAIHTARQLTPARCQRRAQSLNKRKLARTPLRYRLIGIARLR